VRLLGRSVYRGPSATGGTMHGRMDSAAIVPAPAAATAGRDMPAARAQLDATTAPLTGARAH